MYAATTSVALVGGTVRPVMVEAHVGRQQDVFKLSGLPDTAVREAKDRVRAAVASTGLRFPNRTITVNLAPAELLTVIRSFCNPTPTSTTRLSVEPLDVRAR
ncbi:MAG: hypothetical protein IH943_05435 [Acidobacteria bacterium]|nr:hypothetical protein [Acidobacteriota bacterium]